MADAELGWRKVFETIGGIISKRGFSGEKGEF